MCRFARVAPLLFVVAAVSAMAQSQTPNSPTLHDRFKAEPQEQFVPYWTAEPGWHTELMLRNNLETVALVVTPILRSENGAEFALPAVSIAPRSAKSVNVHDALMQSHFEIMSAPTSYGSAVLRYTSISHSNLYASVMIHDDGFPIVYHLDGTPMEADSGPGNHEGIWWLPKGTTNGYLVLSNMSQTEQSGVLWLYDQGESSWKEGITLPAKQTLRFSLRDLVSEAGLHGGQGGLSFRMEQGVGAVDAALLLFDEPSGFSATMKMFAWNPAVTLKSRDFARTGKWVTRASMLALEHPDPALQLPADAVLHPQLFLRNTTSRPVKARLSVHWRSAQTDGRVQAPEITLSAQETRVIDVKQLQDSGVVPSNAYWAQATIETDTLPNEVIAVAASFDETLRYGAQTPFSDQLAFHFEGSAWQVDQFHDSIIAAGNGSSQRVKARLTLYYAEGTQKYEIEQTIAPDDEMLVDIGKLIRDRVPDKNGSLLPGDLSSGAYQLRDLAETPAASLYEGKVVTDKTWGHATYGCGVCCGYRAVYFSPDPSGVPVADNAGVDAMGMNACSSGSAVVDGYATSWTSGDTSILTTQVRQISGVSVGSTGHYAELSNILYGPPRYGSPCYLQDVQASGTGNVNSLSCSPSPVTRGSSVTCTLHGPGTASNWKFTSNTISGATVSSASGTTSTTWSGTAVDSGTVTATATSGGGTTTVTASLTVAPRTSGFTYAMPPQPSAPSANGTCVGSACLPTLSSPPTTAEGTFGQAAYAALPNFNMSGSISSGPNQGYEYVTSISDSSQYFYELNPGLTNSGDPFYQAQYGKCGFPSVAQIVGAVQAHEYSGTPSHYSEVAAALANNNPGPAAEKTIAPPGETQADFNLAIQNAINPIFQAAAQAGATEPPTNLPSGINYCCPYQALPAGCD